MNNNNRMIILVLVSVLFAQSASDVHAKQRPNVIFFLVDDLGQRLAIDHLLVHVHLDLVIEDIVPEGIATKERALITEGVLDMFFVDTYYGRKLGWEPTTGSATNVLFDYGDYDLDGVLNAVGEGIYVNSWLGGNADMRIAEELGDMPEGPERQAKEEAIRADIKRLKDEALAADGLYVLATERHESRRIDNQLRGRAGRQGDPGSTRFFLSLGDNLLRIFGGDRVAGLMNAFRVEEDMPIESGMLTRSLEGAQKKVETYYYDIRKQVFEYDEVMNNQRRAVYSERRRVLDGRALKKQVIGYGERTMSEIVEAYVNPDLPPEEWDLAQLVGKVKEFIYLLEDLTPEQVQGLGMDELKAFLQEQLRNAYDLKEGQIEQQRPGLMREAERFFILQQIDTLWREHLQSMDALRESVGLRGYGQKDPLIEYKNEGYDMFLEMMTNMRRNVIYSMFMFQPQAPQA